MVTFTLFFLQINLIVCLFFFFLAIMADVCVCVLVNYHGRCIHKQTCVCFNLIFFING